MLENMRKQGASLFVWVIFGILIAMFVVSFGPQSVGSSQGCRGGGKQTTLVVGDASIDDAGFRFAYNMARPVEGSTLRERLALEALIRRELLAQEADRRGLRVDDDLVDYAITQGEVHYAGQRIDAKGAFFNEEGKGTFDYKQFKNWLRGRMGVTVAMYKRQQRRELLATTMARILAGSVVASREDALSRWIDENTTVMFDVVTYEPARYADALILGDADIDRFLAGHEAEVKSTYQEALYKGKSQIRVGRIFVATTPPPAVPDGAPQPPLMTPATDPARAKLVAARAEIAAGKKKFADVAASLDAEPSFRARRGDWGWYDKGLLTLPDPALNDAAKALEVGKVSEVIDAAGGYYVLTVTDTREGDLTFDQVKRELAEKLARTTWGKEAARRAAIETLQVAQGGKNLRDLFKTPGSEGDKTGAIDWGYEDIPAAWMQAGSGTGSDTGSGSGSATGSGSGSGSGSAAGSGTGSAAGAGSAAGSGSGSSADAIMTPSTDVLPKLGEVRTPSVDTFGPVPRYGTRTPIGTSAEIARALFDELTTGQVAKQIYEVKAGGVDSTPNYVVLQVTSKQIADTKEFEKNVELHVANLSSELGQRYLTEWLTTRCHALAAKGQIQPARSLITPVDENGVRGKIEYVPCESMDAGGL